MSWSWNVDQAVVAIDNGLWQIDLGFQGRRQIIAAYLIRDGEDLTLIECGPASALPNLRAALSRLNVAVEDINRLLVTHIHLDHAGAAGVLAAESPSLKVHVHPFGLPHMIDPSKLVSSATRIYGDQMGALWGAIEAIPQAQLVAYADREEVAVGGRSLRVFFTPGHAWHHVALFDPVSGSLFTGDVAGIRMPGMDYICPPTPPPDFSPEDWKASLATLQAIEARRLCLAHFGTFDDPQRHLAGVSPAIDEFLKIAESSARAGEGSDQLTSRLHDQMQFDLDRPDEEMLASYELATPSYMAAMGLTRYLTKREAARAASA